ncbi:MAG: hypothetical protein EXS36_07445 [Pedosphaera sp.]|nr:hypothetical protein [Pedosphaera sp.]
MSFFLDQLLEHLPHTHVRGESRCVVNGMTREARSVAPGWVYVSVPEAVEPNPYAAVRAAERGAAAVICGPGVVTPRRVPCVRVADARVAYAHGASALHRHPANALKLIGVRGASSFAVAWFLRELLAGCGRVTGLFSTRGSEVGDRFLPQPTEELDSQEFFAQLGALEKLRGQIAVIELTARLDLTRTLTPVPWFGTVAAPADGSYLCDDLYRVIEVKAGPDQSRVILSSPTGRLVANPRIAGERNLRAFVTAARALLRWGLKPSELSAASDRLSAAPGNCEPLAAGQPFSVWIDGADSMNELAQTLHEARAMSRGRVVVVTGGGARHSPVEWSGLVRSAAEAADVIWITGNDPGTLDAAAIGTEFAAQLRMARGGEANVEADRSRAISQAIHCARTGDVVVIAGKGHRRTQAIDGAVIPFEDRLVAQFALAERGYAGGTS